VLATLKAVEERNTYRDDDIQSYVMNVHAMKSALANAGETGLSSIAGKLEEAGRSKDIALLRTETEGFIEELLKVVNKLNSETDGAGNDELYEDSEEDIKYLHEKLLLIKEVCNIYDKKAAKAALSELQARTFSRSTKELLSKISDYLLEGDYEDIKETIEKTII
jgi:HPt (histidine-containing phosphotransfer) domain-containing protein